MHRLFLFAVAAVCAVSASAVSAPADSALIAELRAEVSTLRSEVAVLSRRPLTRASSTPSWLARRGGGGGGLDLGACAKRATKSTLAAFKTPAVQIVYASVIMCVVADRPGRRPRKATRATRASSGVLIFPQQSRRPTRANFESYVLLPVVGTLGATARVRYFAAVEIVHEERHGASPVAFFSNVCFACGGWWPSCSLARRMVSE
jgi:hypothetical protein